MSDPKKNVCNLHSARDTRKEEVEEGAEMDAVKRGEEWDGGPVRRQDTEFGGAGMARMAYFATVVLREGGGGSFSLP